MQPQRNSQIEERDALASLQKNQPHKNIYIAPTGFNDWLPQYLPVKLLRRCENEESLRHFGEEGWALVEIVAEGQFRQHRFFTPASELIPA